ncbi:neuron navigator 3-like isoform X13 [Lineus longissimus]|uniref:neuron navigator 3-like isoform X13 n=1 Tax=Lineus longissimus TaxID=88925 RepID=UPI00315C58A2
MAAEADPDSDEGIQEDEEFDYEKGPKIYTDWANHYLEKARNKRFITDLQQDISDGVLLADVIEAVTNEKVRDIKSKPRNSAQMVDNINACLCFLSNLGVNVEGLSAKDIKEGNLKAILGLFFSLSRYKQQQKHATQVASTRNVNANVTAESQSKLPSPYSGKQSSKCPTVTNPSTKDAPGGANLNKNKSHSFNAADRNKTLLNQANNNTLSLSPGTASKNNNPSSRETSSSRSTSPSNVSNIPTPGGRGLGLGRSQSLSDKYGHRIVNSTSTSSASSAASGTSRSTSGYSTSASSTTGRIPSNKNSMLDKFKFFGSKDKTGSKSGVPAKASSKSSTSSRDSDTLRSSYSDSRPGSARNSAHEPISAQAGSASPKTSKSLKKSLGKALTSSKREGSPKPSKGKDDSIPRGKTPPPNAGRMVQPMATSSVSSSDRASSRGSPPSSRRSSSALQAPRSVSKSDMKSGQASPDAGKKGSKASSMIPKNAAKTNGKPAASTGLNSPNSHIPMPNTAIPKPSGIAKPGAKAAMHKDERRLKNDSKHGSRSQLHASTSKHNGMIPNNHESASLGSHDRSRDHRDSREQSSRHHDLDQKSVASHSSSSHRADSSHSRSSQGQGQSADHAHSKENPSRLNNNLVSQSHHDQRGDRNANMSAAESSSRLQRGARQSQEPTTPQGHSSNSQLPTHTNSLPRKMVSSGGTQTNASSLQRQQKHREQIQQHHEQQQQLHHQQQQHSSHSQQPQHHTQQPQHHVQQQQHHAQQPQHHAQQHLQQQSSSQVRSLDRKERTPQSGATAKLQRTENKIDNRKSSKANAEHRRDSNDSRSHSSSNSHSNSGTSSNDSVIYNPSCDELSTDSDARRSASQKQKNTQGNASPEVGMTPHNKYVKHTIPKNNKVETTFDSDVRTETVHTNSLPKGSGRKETTIAEDGGETMDVKPMQPIMTRSSPAYGYLRTGPANKSYGMYSSLNYSSGRLGLHRPLIPDGSKYFSLKRTMSGCSNTNSSNVPDDYGSDIEGYDVAAGYMSDGDILRPNAHVEDFSGYMSEGGASLYAKRMQQRFREGIEAVEECMRKSSGLIDDDSFDDSSSISSGDISDTIGDISTDENLTGSSVSASSDYHHPYGSLKRPPKPDINTLVGKTGSYYGAKTSYIGNKNLNHADYDYTAWRKYNGEQQHNYVNLDYSSEPDTSTLSHWRKERNDLKSCYATTNSLRRHSDAQTIKASAENLVQHDGGSSVQAQIQQARAHSMATRNILSHNRDSFTYGVDRNGHSSNKSERLSQTLSQHLDGDLPRTSSYQQINQSQPSSPTPSVGSQSSSRFTYPMTALSPTMVQSASTHSLVRSSSQQSNLPYAGIGMPLTKSGSRDEEVHGSQLSLVSSSSSLYSANPSEEKQASEIRKLRRELESAQEKVLTLTSQLSTNAHVVAAFEQSLSNMTTRLQSLTVTAEQKDSELTDLRITIESLRKQSGGITCEALDRTPVIPRRSSSLKPEQQVTSPSDAQNLSRQISSDSMSSINSLSSACSVTSQQSSITESDKKKGKKGKGSWLRSSFSKAFSSNKNKKSKGSASDLDETSSMHSDISVPNSPLLQGLHSNMPGTPLSGMKLSNSSHALGDDEECRVLQKQLQEKDMKLTDIRLEALSSAHQLEQLRETMTRMKTEMSSLKQDNKRLHTMVSSQNSLNRLDGSYGNLELSENEMSTLKADNDRLQRMVHSGSKPSSPSSPCAPMTLSPKGSDDLDKRLSLGEDHASNLDMLLNDSSDRDGRRISISVYSGNETDVKQLMEIRPPEIYLGTMSVSGKIRWDMLDSIVKRIFKDYCIRVDPVSHLGLNSESVLCYHIGEIIRIKGSNAKDPELLPCGYLVGEDMSIKIVLKGSQHNSVDNVAFETLIPKSIIQRYISLLIEHRRIILCGPSGTGKTYLAQKLATYLVLRSGKELAPTAIATFNVDHKSSKELRQYLTNIAEQCESSSASELPSVVILDNLHHVGSLGEVFNGFLSCKYLKCPYIIGTMNQATCSTTNLQLHHNFRWVLCANHMEPVKGFLGRYLRRKLIEAEVKTGMRNNDLNKMSEWMPKVWQHLNKFLETHSSSDVTIGPRLFLSCPMDMSGSQVWFTDLWNYSIVPYMLEAVREGLQVRNLYGRRAPWEDPAEWVIETYPWGPTNDGHSEDWPSLQRLRPEDVGYDTQGMVGEGKAKATQQAQSDVEGDPLLNMLMRLQEAASYSSPQSNDSDNTSLDSHSTNDMNKSDHGSSSRTNSGSVESTI